ncbi:3-hydroxyacyl-CoA dehydrogenase NAD-binding [Chloroherpeton thalassium ATCC 35110]|uniref:3-hydroxyacyl-CoA dehydrogenase NAD-binding n=1 Tax=Chloroherpeton thalassium (strain ATCC 35110 / GB-78) TaxID=517418 RepID=B3QSG8_CHLT3|nr:3-hydroxyacyl-CoA dehydrogenase family protein [Chloroherpeton thalassium]ACF12559.1 3-hydroxyacyl-CoA dehydrogenase NAD-binding [Chloroherpeton thalassium ATCC 35110]
MNSKIIGIVGAKSSGVNMAITVAKANHSVLIYDPNPVLLQQVTSRVRKVMEKWQQRNLLTPKEANLLVERICPVSTIKSLSSADAIFETGSESLEKKKELFKSLDEFSPESIILVSTSAFISVTTLASVCFFKKRVIGMQIHHQSSMASLIELSQGMDTSREVLKQSIELGRSLAKEVVICYDMPGLIVHRVSRNFFGEALRIFEEGTASMLEIDAFMRQAGGFHLGPFELLDCLGIDKTYISDLELYNAFFQEPRFRPTHLMKTLFESGYYGKKSGRGFYDYSINEAAPRMAIQQSEQEAARKFFQNHYISLFMVKQAVFARIIAMLVNEALFCVQENVSSEGDVDLAMKYGMSFPKGPIEWGREIGFDKIASVLNALYNEFRDDRYRPAPLLKIYQ